MALRPRLRKVVRQTPETDESGSPALAHGVLVTPKPRIDHLHRILSDKTLGNFKVRGAIPAAVVRIVAQTIGNHNAMQQFRITGRERGIVFGFDGEVAV